MSKACKYFILFLIIAGCNQNSKDGNPIHKPSDDKLNIELLPYSGFDTSLLPLIQSEVDSFYHCKCIFLKTYELPSSAYYSPRNRYKADSLLVFESQLSGKDDIIVGLTNKDISTRKNDIPDWGILGLGLCPGNSCVISTFRLKQGSSYNNQLKERLIKIVLHEIGHNFGLPHCTNDPQCLMNDAEGTISQVDKEKKWLCNKCRQRIGL